MGTSSPNRSPFKSQKSAISKVGAFTLAAPPQPSRKRPKRQKMLGKHTQSASEHSLQNIVPIDMLTGGDLDCERERVVKPKGHTYSSSMPSIYSTLPAVNSDSNMQILAKQSHQIMSSNQDHVDKLTNQINTSLLDLNNSQHNK